MKIPDFTIPLPLAEQFIEIKEKTGKSISFLIIEAISIYLEARKQEKNQNEMPEM